MFFDARKIRSGSVLEGDICVVGAGHAGLSFAQAFEGTNLRVIVLESGGFRRDERTQSLYRGTTLSPHVAPLHMYRERFLGGTSNVWGGRCAPYDSIDMEPRPWVPEANWPLDRREMDPYYARAYELLDIGRYGTFVNELLPNSTQDEMIPGFNSQIVRTDWLWLYSLPTNFRKKFRPLVERSESIYVYLYANVTNIVTNSSGDTVTHLEVVTLQKNRFYVRARYYVLATGALETVRLLMVSNKVHKHGIGNHSGHLGRWFISQITGKIGPVKFYPKDAPLIWGYEKTIDGVYCRRAFRIDEKVQRQEELPNCRIIFDNPPAGDARHKSAVLSAMYLGKRLLNRRIPPEYSRELSAMAPLELRNIGPHLWNVVLDFPSLIGFFINWLPKRIASKRKIPSLMFPSKDDTYWLHYDIEQFPSYDSKVFLGNERDILGMRRLVVDYKLTSRDIKAAVSCITVLKNELEETGRGRFLFDFDEDKMFVHIAKYTGVGNHIYGVTRMAEDPKDGVVDRNGKVWGLDNLYLATSGVFPTSSFANPVLTICAFALRLADHVKSLFKREM